MASLARRLAEAAAVELARLDLMHSNRFIREELLYPLMAISPSAERWRPSAEASFAARKIGSAARRGDIPRADLKFWRLDSADTSPLEVIVEIKLFKSALPTRVKTLHAALAKIQGRHTRASIAAAKADRQRYVIGVFVARLSRSAARRAPELKVDTHNQTALPRLLAESIVYGEFGTQARAYLLLDNTKPRRSLARPQKMGLTARNLIN